MRPALDFRSRSPHWMWEFHAGLYRRRLGEFIARRVRFYLLPQPYCKHRDEVWRVSFFLASDSGGWYSGFRIRNSGFRIQAT